MRHDLPDDLAHLSRGGLMHVLGIDPRPTQPGPPPEWIPPHLLVDPFAEPERWAELERRSA